MRSGWRRRWTRWWRFWRPTRWLRAGFQEYGRLQHGSERARAEQRQVLRVWPRGRLRRADGT